MYLEEDAHRVLHALQERRRCQYVDDQPRLEIVPQDMNHADHHDEYHEGQDHLPHENIADVFFRQLFSLGHVSHADIAKAEVGEHLKNRGDVKAQHENAVLLRSQVPSHQEHQDEQEKRGHHGQAGIE